ncbi:MAG: hypothetical protein R8K46_02780 [Mariprofundaceae bacterium]
MILALTGRVYSENESKFMERMLVVTSYPDPRIWCNRVAALAGTSRCSATSSLSAGLASSEGTLFGWRTTYYSAKFLEKAQQISAENGQAALETFINKTLSTTRSIHGFGRPLAGGEERIAPIDTAAEELGISNGPYLTTAKLIESMLTRSRLFLNYGGYTAGRLMDLRFSSIEVYRVLTMAFYIGLLPCYVEAFENEPGTFLPIACEDILYEGREERPLPE